MVKVAPCLPIVASETNIGWTSYKAVHNGTTCQLSHTLPKVVKSHKRSSSHAQSHTPETHEGLEKVPLVGMSQSHALSSTSEMREGPAKVPLIEIMQLHEAL